MKCSLLFLLFKVKKSIYFQKKIVKFGRMLHNYFISFNKILKVR